MEYPTPPPASDNTTPLSEEEMSDLLIKSGHVPRDPITTAAPKVEDCYLPTNKIDDDSYCAPDTMLADIGFDLAHLAYSSLARTPEGLPPSGFFLWDQGGTNQPIIGCCDSLVVSLADYRPYNENQTNFHEAYSSYVAGLCDELAFIAAFDIKLMRSCRPVFDSDGKDFSSSAKRNAHGYNLMVDLRTMMCCVNACLSNETVGGLNFGHGEYFIGRSSISGVAHCSSVTFQVGLALPTCCPEGDYAAMLQMPEQNIC